MVSMDQRSQGNDVLISFAKLLHLRGALTSFDKIRGKKKIFLISPTEITETTEILIGSVLIDDTVAILWKHLESKLSECFEIISTFLLLENKAVLVKTVI